MAENEAAIHHRPTVSSEAVTDKANRINKALAQAPLLCSQTSPWPLYLLFLLQKFHLFLSSRLKFLVQFSLHFCRFQVTSFICVGLQLLSILSLSALLPGPGWTYWYTAELSGLDRRWKKEKSTSERKKRPRPEDYRRPFSLLVHRHLHQTNAYLIFSEGDSSSRGLNLPKKTV